jgi:hypothetical protein
MKYQFAFTLHLMTEILCNARESAFVGEDRCGSSSKIDTANAIHEVIQATGFRIHSEWTMFQESQMILETVRRIEDQQSFGASHEK